MASYSPGFPYPLNQTSDISKNTNKPKTMSLLEIVSTK